MEFVLQSLFELHVHSCTHGLRPCNPAPPRIYGLIYEGAIGQPRAQDSQHLYVIPWFCTFIINKYRINGATYPCYNILGRSGFREPLASLRIQVAARLGG
jgi:hypothetical protein